MEKAPIGAFSIESPVRRRVFSLIFKIEAAFFIIDNGVTDQNTDYGCNRDGDHQTEEAEQNTAGQQSKHNPDRVQADVVADQFGGKEVTFQKLSDHKNDHNA